VFDFSFPWQEVAVILWAYVSAGIFFFKQELP
jgi:hypothetical protein